jgi:hypothetical protein
MVALAVAAAAPWCVTALHAALEARLRARTRSLLSTTGSRSVEKSGSKTRA